jgi:hypothetical protein
MITRPFYRQRPAGQLPLPVTVDRQPTLAFTLTPTD